MLTKLHHKKVYLLLLLVILALLLSGSIWWYQNYFLAKNNQPESSQQEEIIINERSYFKKCLIENVLGSSYHGRLPRNIAKVEGVEVKEIYRSGYLDKKFIPALQKLGIKSIITLSSVSEETKQAIKKAGLAHKEFGFSTTEMTKAGIQAAIKEILNLPDPVLVHCHHGADRTGLVMAALKATLGEKDSNKLFKEMRKYCHLPRKKYEYFHNLLAEFINNDNLNKNQ